MFEEDIRELNKNWLMLVRSAARSKPEEVSWRLAMDAESVKWLASLSIEDMDRIARCGVGLFSIRVDASLIRKIDSGRGDHIILKNRRPFLDIGEVGS